MRTFCGTPNYAAVELISGIPYVGVKSDIWAMGVVLYVMMTGRPPFVGENISSLYSKIKAVDYKCPSYFSQELRNLLGKLLVRDPKQRADMEAIRHDAWVNYEEIELPLQISPKIIGNVDPSLIGQFISSIHHDQAFIIYTFRSHTLDADRLAGIKKQALRRQSKANALEKPRISTTESERSRTNSIITDMTNSRPSIVKGSRRLSLGGSNLGSTPISPAITSTVSPPPSITLTPPNVTATYPSNSRLKRRSTITGDQASSFNAQNAPPVITIEGNEKFDLTPPIATWNSGTRSRSMNRQRNASQPVNPQPPLSPQPAQKVSGGRRNTVTNIGNGMCTPVSLAPTDRDLTIIRRMSQVGPTGDLVIGLTEPQQKNSGPSSFSSGMDVSGNVIRHRRGHSASGPDDLDPMTGTDEDLVEMDEPEISNKEIEDWHLLHRPPKTIRTVRFTFNSNTTSSLAAFMVFQEVHRVLVCLQLQHGGRLTFTRPDDLYLLNCKLASTLPEDNVEFEVEVCKLWLLKLHGVRIKRLSGNPFIFKDVYNML
ncbi:Serine/threonine-protein kinase par-1, partial [Nowakowskiella sp. JEL0407]